MKLTYRPISTWPGERRRTHHCSPFRSTWGKTLKLLQGELEKVGAEKAVIEIDLQERHFRLDGLPYASAPNPRYPGVVISFESKHGPLRYPCDKFDRWADNVRAIALTLERLRSVGRYGVTPHGEQYRGWKQLPAASMSTRGAADILADYCHGAGYRSETIEHSPEVAKSAYKIAARATHPDRGGEVDDFHLIREAAQALGVDV